MKLSVGLGIVFASLNAWWTGVHSPNAALVDYWTALPTFGIAFGLTLAALQVKYLPLAWVEFWGHVATAEKYKTEIHVYRQQRQTTTVYLRPLTQVSSNREEGQRRKNWRHFLILCSGERMRVNSVAYRKMEDFFGSDQAKWREYVDCLVEWGVAWPIQPGVETFLKPGQTPQLLYDLFTGDELPPTPLDRDPPLLTPRQQSDESTVETAGKKRSTPRKQASIASTAYSSEHRT